MTEYALVNPQNGVGRYSSSVDPTVSTRPGWRWLPVEVTGPGAIDPATQVKEGPVVTVLADRVTRVWSVRAKTAQELDDDKTAQANNLNRVYFEIAFNHENRIRAGAGQAAVTRAQFRAAIKALL